MKNFKLLLLAAGLFMSCTKQKIETTATAYEASAADKQLAADLGFDLSSVQLVKPTGPVKYFSGPGALDSARKWIRRVSILHHSRSIKFAAKEPTSMPESETNTFYESYYHWMSDKATGGGQHQETVSYVDWFPGGVDGFKVSFVINYDPVTGAIASVTSVQGRLQGFRIITGFLQDNSSASVIPGNNTTYITYEISGDQYYGVAVEGHVVGLAEGVRVRGTYNTATQTGTMHYEKVPKKN